MKTMRNLLVLSLPLAGCLTMLAADPDLRPVKVFLCAGQSNMAGAGSRAGLSADDAKLFPDREVRFWFADPAQDKASPGWSRLGDPVGKFGPEQMVGVEMKRAFPGHRIAIVKVSRGATPIRYWLPPGKPGQPGEPGHLTLARTIREVTERLDAEKASGEIPGWAWAGFFWMQGEGDANGTMAPAGTYLPKLRELAAWAREQTATPGLPIVIGRISAQLSPAVVRDTGMLRISRAKSADGKGIADNADHLDDGQRRGPIWFEKKLLDVRADQEAFCAADPRAAWVDIDDLVLRDSYHYDAAGYAEMGRRFAKACRALLDGQGAE